MKECYLCGINLVNVPDDYEGNVACYSCFDTLNLDDYFEG